MRAHQGQTIVLLDTEFVLADLAVSLALLGTGLVGAPEGILTLRQL